MSPQTEIIGNLTYLLEEIQKISIVHVIKIHSYIEITWWFTSVA